MINQTRIRNTKKLLRNIKPNETFVLGIEAKEEIIKKLTVISNPHEIKPGIQFFPSPELGIMSKRNSIGEEIPQKDLPKEIAYRAHEWKLLDWGGYEHTGISYIPYHRYPRKFIAPQELKLELVETNQNEQLVIVSKEMQNNTDNHELIIFAANLMLELFGAVTTYLIDKNTGIVLSPNIIRVDWEILPKGEPIWDYIKSATRLKVSTSEQKLIHARLKFIEEFEPTNIFQGIGGYTGYLVFEFSEKRLYIFDSIMYGNATYIFNGDWKKFSKLTKKEIISNNLAIDRIIHNNSWENNIKKHLN